MSHYLDFEAQQMQFVCSTIELKDVSGGIISIQAQLLIRYSNGSELWLSF